jgi:hypothetical protein
MTTNPMPTVSVCDTWRNRQSARLANLALRLASDDYRRFIKGALILGMETAAERVTIPEADLDHAEPDAIDRIRLAMTTPPDIAGEGAGGEGRG